MHAAPRGSPSVAQAASIFWRSVCMVIGMSGAGGYSDAPASKSNASLTTVSLRPSAASFAFLTACR